MGSESEFERGDRVELVHTTDQYTGLRPGDQGVVVRVREDPWGETISINWDSGSTLSILTDEGDQVRKVQDADDPETEFCHYSFCPMHEARVAMTKAELEEHIHAEHQEGG